MPTYWLALIITTLVAASYPAGEAGVQGVFATCGMVLAWGTLGKLAARAAACRLSSERASATEVARRLDRILNALRWAWLPVLAVCLAGFGAAGWIESLPGPDRLLAMRGLLLLLPSIAVTALLLLAEDQFVSWARSDPKAVWQALRRVGRSLRLQAGWLLLPLILVLAIVDLGTHGFGADPALAGSWSGVAALVVLPLALPWLVCRAWKTTPLADPWLSEIARATGIRGLKIRRWNTDGRLCTAVVVGFFPGCRVMLLSDELLRLLSRPQVAMVVLHELAHLRRWHLPLRLAALAPAWIAAAIVTALAPPIPAMQPAAMTVGFVLTLLLLRSVAHRTELDADRVACFLATQAAPATPEVPSSRSAAAVTLAAALRAVTGDCAAARRPSWMHPGLDARVALLGDLAALQEPTIPTTKTSRPILANQR